MRGLHISAQSDWQRAVVCFVHFTDGLWVRDLCSWLENITIDSIVQVFKMQKDTHSFIDYLDLITSAATN